MALSAAALTSSGIATAAATSAVDGSREEVARSYLDALVSHDASRVPFAPDCTQVEAGIQTGYSGPQLTTDLEHGAQYDLVQSIHDVRLSTAGDVVTARYLLGSGIAGVPIVTVDITETFVVTDGEIQRIDATIVPVSVP
ncbi:hypothetical protein NRB56_07870 [Nocardia sp. RB56]|uniref:DUF8021 domain-containing protein n=1 Tax=Nocardia aurantia TaxID=2585199 RepID=A0A7K0DI21_9NOCA|nr:hypothetical protein [Nocardia aurantia]